MSTVVSEAPPLKTPADFPAYLPGVPVVGPTLQMMRDPLGYHLEAHRRHGWIYRTTFFGNEQICIGGIDANKFIWDDSENWSYQKSRSAFTELWGEDYLTQLDGEKHMKKRKRLNPAFRPEFLMRASAGMTAVLKDNLAQAAEAGAPLEMRRFCYQLLIRMTSTALLGVTLPSDVEDAILLVERDLLIGSLFGPVRRTWWGRPAFKKARDKVVDFLGRIVDQWTEHPEGRSDMFSEAIKKQPDGEQLSRWELIGDLYLLITGGLNSTANLALWSMMYVYSRPDWLAQMREEIAAVPPEQFSAMKQWPRIKATALEIERLRPATPFSTLITAREFEFKGVRFPANAAVSLFLTMAHYMPDIYEDPEAFKPERFMGETNYPARSHSPFGGGAHICIGMPLARLQVPLIMASVIERYDVEFEKKPNFRGRMGSALTPADRKIMARLVKRG